MQRRSKEEGYPGGCCDRTGEYRQAQGKRTGKQAEQTRQRMSGLGKAKPSRPSSDGGVSEVVEDGRRKEEVEEAGAKSKDQVRE